MIEGGRKWGDWGGTWVERERKEAEEEEQVKP
jgi:hypothetical protein